MRMGGVLVAIAFDGGRATQLFGDDVVCCSPTDIATQLDAHVWDLVVVAPEFLPLPSGNYIVAAWLSDPVQAADAVAAGADHVLLDPAPELTRAVVALAQRERKRRDWTQALEVAIEHVSDGVEIAAADAKIRAVNPAYTRHCGYTADDAIGHTPAELTRSEVHKPEHFAGIWQTLQSGRSWSGALVGRRKDGSLLHQMTTVTPVLSSGECMHIVGVKTYFPWLNEDAPDEDLQKLVTRLKTSEQRHRVMIASAGDSMLVADHETNVILDANPAAMNLYGYALEELRGLTTDQILAKTENHSEVTQNVPRLQRVQLRKKDGTTFFGDLRLTVTEIGGRRVRIGIVRDVTEQIEREQALEETNRRLVEAQRGLLRSARLAAIGELAAGVAHEINNPLQFLSTNLAVMEESVSDAHQELLRDAKEGVRRIASIVRALVPFSRIATGGPKPVDINDVVRWALRITENEIRHHAELVTKLEATASFLGHEEQLGQLVTNLLINAMNAIQAGSSSKNRIVVSTRSSAQTIRLEVADSGVGIPADQLEQIFEPFYTTRRDGTGLGLALSAEIARAHAGTISVEASNLGGACFVVEFPLPEEPVRAAKTPTEKPAPQVRARILLIDDEPGILRAYARMLSRDLDVVTAGSGRGALDRIAGDKRFDAVVCDLMMPIMDGPAFYTQLKAVAPELVRLVVFCSGGAFTAEARAFIKDADVPVVSKSIDRNDLLTTIQELTES